MTLRLHSAICPLGGGCEVQFGDMLPTSVRKMVIAVSVRHVTEY